MANFDSVSENQQPPRKTSNIIYFLIGIIAFLIGTNIYVFLKKNEREQQLVVKTAAARDEKESMTAELNKLESDLATATNSNKKLTSDLRAKDQELKNKIEELRSAIKSRKLTAAEFASARHKISELRNSVQEFNTQIASLKQENKHLTTENTTLKTTVDSVSKKTTELESQNELLAKKVSVGSALKTSAIEAIPVNVRSNGREIDARSAKKAKKIRVNFTVADNDLSLEGSHDIYMQILDPFSRIETGESSGNFHTSDGQELQYTTRSSINYLKTNRSYSLEWPKSTELTPGEYKVVLWADGYKMGESGFKLKKGGLF